jgi:hypothetical protein
MVANMPIWLKSGVSPMRIVEIVAKNTEIFTETTLPYLSLIKPKMIDPIGLAITAMLNIAKNSSIWVLFVPNGKKFLDKVAADKPKRA